MAKQFGNVWLCRDKGGRSNYWISRKRPTLVPTDDRTYWECTGVMEPVAPNVFHSLTDVRLKPGEGPVRAQVSIVL